MHGNEFYRKTATMDAQNGPDCTCHRAQLHCAPINGRNEHIARRSGRDGWRGIADVESSCDDRIVVYENVGVCNGRGGATTFASQYSDIKQLQHRVRDGQSRPGASLVSAAACRVGSKRAAHRRAVPRRQKAPVGCAQDTPHGSRATMTAVPGNRKASDSGYSDGEFVTPLSDSQ